MKKGQAYWWITLYIGADGTTRHCTENRSKPLQYACIITYILLTTMVCILRVYSFEHGLNNDVTIYYCHYYYYYNILSAWSNNLSFPVTTTEKVRRKLRLLRWISLIGPGVKLTDFDENARRRHYSKPIFA